MVLWTGTPPLLQLRDLPGRCSSLSPAFLICKMGCHRPEMTQKPLHPLCLAPETQPLNTRGRCRHGLMEDGAGLPVTAEIPHSFRASDSRHSPVGIGSVTSSRRLTSLSLSFPVRETGAGTAPAL